MSTPTATGLHLPAGSAAGHGYDLEVTPEVVRVRKAELNASLRARSKARAKARD